MHFKSSLWRAHSPYIHSVNPETCAIVGANHWQPHLHSSTTRNRIKVFYNKWKCSYKCISISHTNPMRKKDSGSSKQTFNDWVSSGWHWGASYIFFFLHFIFTSPHFSVHFPFFIFFVNFGIKDINPWDIKEEAKKKTRQIAQRKWGKSDKVLDCLPRQGRRVAAVDGNIRRHAVF